MRSTRSGVLATMMVAGLAAGAVAADNAAVKTTKFITCAANGIPRNAFTSPSIRPSTLPCFVFT